jgi:hypothetical protein
MIYITNKDNNFSYWIRDGERIPLFLDKGYFWALDAEGNLHKWLTSATFPPSDALDYLRKHYEVVEE